MNNVSDIWYFGFCGALSVAVLCLFALAAATGVAGPVMERLTAEQHRMADRLARLQSHTFRLYFPLLSVAMLAQLFALACLVHAAAAVTDSHTEHLLLGAGMMAQLVLGVFLPWSLGVRWSERVALLCVPWIEFWQLVCWPLTRLGEWISGAGNGHGDGSVQAGLTEHELRTLITKVEDEGTIDQDEKALIHNVLEMDEIETHQIMIPRVDMCSLEFTMTIRDALPEIQKSGYSRIPVYEEQVDKIQGVVYVKDLLPYLAGNQLDTPLRSVMRTALFVTENLPANKLLQMFRDKHVHIAMVVDEYGGIQGMLTIEDVLEELVGEIYDETDTEERLVRLIGPGKYRVLGKISIEELNEQLHVSLETSGLYETISGLVLYQLGHIPEEGETLTADNLDITVAKVADQRIQELLVTKTA
jgi:putative hemolysin